MNQLASGMRSWMPIWTLIVAIALGGAAWAAEPPVVGPEPAGVDSVLGPGSVPTEATALDALLVRVLLRSEPSSAVRARAETLGAREVAVVRDASATRSRLGAPTELHDARATWSIRERALRTELADLSEHAASLEQDLQLLEGLGARWSAGRKALPTNAPASLFTKADRAIEAIDAARRELDSRNVETLEAVVRLAALHGIATAVLEDVDQAARDVVFSRESVEVWSLPRALASSGDLWPTIAATCRARARHITTYVLEARWSVLFQLALAVAAAWLFVGSHRLPEERRPSRSHPTWRTLVERPMTSAVLLSLGVGTVLHARAPSAFLDLMVAIAFVPLLRVRRLLIPSVASKPAGLLFVLYLLNRSVALLSGSGAAYRIGLIAVDVLAVVAMLWGLRELTRHASGAEPPAGRVPRGLLLAALLASATALLANLVGFVALAAVLVDRMMEVLYLTVVIWTTVALLDGCVRFAARLPAAQRLGMVRNHEDALEDRLGQLLRLTGALALGANLVFLLSLESPLSRGVRQTLELGLTVGTIDVSLGGVLAFAVCLWLAVVLSRGLRFALDEDVLPRLHLPKGVPAAMLTLTHYGVIGTGLVLALAAAGAHLQQFAFLAGALGIGIGFGLQGIVNNLVSGLILLFERPIQVGDIIELGPMTGTVQHIGMRACRVRTLDGAEVIVPNSDLLTDPVVNWTLSDRVRRFDVTVGVAYGSRPEQVLALLQEAAAGTPGVLAVPAPETLLEDFGSSSIDFLVRAWAPYDEHLAVRSATRVRIEAALRQAGIEIPFPQRDLHVRSNDAAVLASGATEPAPTPSLVQEPTA